jgi:hypothetical protein
MDVGILWHDDDVNRGLDEKVARAVAFVRTLYGLTPTVCFVNPGMLSGGTEVVAGVQLRPDSAVTINHFWFGAGNLSPHLGHGLARNRAEP